MSRKSPSASLAAARFSWLGASIYVSVSKKVHLMGTFHHGRMRTYVFFFCFF